MDTYDLIRYHGHEFRVACVHGDILHTIGYPERRLLVESCELVEAATDAQRMQALHAMANSTAQTHRPVCARARLAAESE